MSQARTILVIDDDPDLRMAVVDALEDEGIAAITADHGRSALALLREARALPDLILLDMMMPVMNGAAFAAELQKDPRLARIPVVVFTARPDADRVAEQLGAAASLAKPLKLEQLLEIARHFPTT